jgi:multidrug efflux pump subunit AcrB
VLVAILASVSLGFFKLVVLKMLPFDNKSEFQIVLDMPVGTPLEETAKVLREISAEIAQVPEVADYQAYAGTAAPINFNGLVRQYYLRSAPEMGDIQVNLVDARSIATGRATRSPSRCASAWSPWHSSTAAMPR